MKWTPTGKLVMIRLHTTGSTLLLEGSDIQYNGLAEVLAIGDQVTTVQVGDEVVINGPAGIISHKELGEHIGLIPEPLVLAKRTDWKSGEVTES